MRTITALFALCAACSGSFGERPGTSLEPSSGPAPSIGSCPVFPADNDWNRDISGGPFDPHTSAYMQHNGWGPLNLHAEFRHTPTHGRPYLARSVAQPRVPLEYRD